MFRIDEILPDDPLHAEVVLHVRRLLRSRIRRGDRAWESLALLFGFEGTSNRALWEPAAGAANPIRAGAAVAARLRGLDGGIVPLGHDRDHAVRCHALLRERKHEDAAFHSIIATDLGTLLELSKAREFAMAEGLDDDGETRPLPFLIRGETGTGKELLARAIHELTQNSDRSRPYNVIHVAGMTPDMINAEIFGHIKGAFTDAKMDRPGRLEESDGGTVLIDEVGDLPDAAQLRLLRFLQTQRVSRLGQNRERKVRVRVIAATWHDLEKDVEERRFRQDLLYRLRVGAELILPPLRERQGVFDEVVPEILARRHHTASPPLARSTRDALALHRWQGNLRELVGVLEQALAVCDGETLRVEHLPSPFQRAYLSLPLRERAAGFLADDLEGQSLDEDHVAWRAREVAASLEALPLPDPSPEIELVTRVLSMVDDSSAEHQQTQATVNSYGSLTRELQRRAEIAEVWRTLSESQLPAIVTTEVRRRHAEAAEHAARLEAQLSALIENLHLEQHPWLALLKAAMDSPILAKVDRENLVTGFISVFSVIRAVAPDFIDEAREAMRSGGVPALRQRIVEALQEKDDETILAPQPPRRKPESLTVEDWEDLARHPSLASASKTSGFNGKTINKYLDRHGIKRSWRSRL